MVVAALGLVAATPDAFDQAAALVDVPATRAPAWLVAAPRVWARDRHLQCEEFDRSSADDVRRHEVAEDTGPMIDEAPLPSEATWIWKEPRFTTGPWTATCDTAVSLLDRDPADASSRWAVGFLGPEVEVVQGDCHATGAGKGDSATLRTTTGGAEARVLLRATDDVATFAMVYQGILEQRPVSRPCSAASRDFGRTQACASRSTAFLTLDEALVRDDRRNGHLEGPREFRWTGTIAGADAGHGDPVDCSVACPADDSVALLQSTNAALANRWFAGAIPRSDRSELDLYATRAACEAAAGRSSALVGPDDRADGLRHFLEGHR